MPRPQNFSNQFFSTKLVNLGSCCRCSRNSYNNKHWETLSINSITLSKTSSYHVFEAQVGELFSGAIGSNDFRLYTLPFKSEELDEKLRLTGSQIFRRKA